jgi:hypothetical protein
MAKVAPVFPANKPTLTKDAANSRSGLFSRKAQQLHIQRER